MDRSETYPGHSATPEQVRMLALEYHDASCALLARWKRGRPASWAPARLLAIQSIELQLNAYLLRSGIDAARLRGLQHDLAGRGDLAVASGLNLRRRTHAISPN